MLTKGYLITYKSDELKKTLLASKKRVLYLRGPKKNRCHFQDPRRFKKRNLRGLEDRKGWRNKTFEV